MEKKLLIVEEALRDLKAHWFEYIKTVQEAVQRQGWQVEVAANKQASPEIIRTFTCYPIFERARYLTGQKEKLPGERYYGFVLHSMRCLKALWPLLKKHTYDTVFVPTVLVHHLLAWYILMRFHPNKPQRLILFFVTPPGEWDEHSKQTYFPRSTRVTGKLLRLFAKPVAAKRVTLAVETGEARKQFEKLSGLPFALLPHPVPFGGRTLRRHPSHVGKQMQKPGEQTVSFGCFGFARYEKGSDLLKNALVQILEDKHSNSLFLVQWTDPFVMPDGSTCSPGGLLENHPGVTIINKPVDSREYQELLAQTDCMILPYRNAAYHARVSRIAIEAACNGIPIIYTKGGWLQENVENFGAGVGITDGSVDDLVEAIRHVNSRFEQFFVLAQQSMHKARAYYSPDRFSTMLLHIN